MSEVRCFLLVPVDGEQRLDARQLYRRADGEPGEWTLADAPPGAMWYCEWMRGCEGGPWMGGDPPDGWLAVRLPNGHDWMPDTRARNCTMPEDNAHRCWVREGEPPNVTVTKNGPTCGAGAGSIGSGSYHGFLRGGVLIGD